MTSRDNRHDQEKPLPTDYAIAIAEKFGIYQEVDTSDFTAMQQREEDLRMFQQMSISGTFEEAMLAYYDREFTDEQMQALKLIYKATSHWLRGEVVGVLLSKIQNTKITNKDFAESISTIIEQLSNEGENGDKKPTDRVRGLTVKLAGKDNG